MADEPTPLRVLVVDDDPGDQKILSRLLGQLDRWRAEVWNFEDPCGAEEALRASPADLLFLDYRLGACTGLEVFHKLRERGVEVPVVMLTGQGNETVAVEAMKAGLADYLPKGSLTRDSLERVVANALARGRLEREHQETQRRLEELARTDPLTGLANRRVLLEFLDHQVAVALRHRLPLSVFLADLDHFKGVNDRFGHLTGDQVLAATAEALRDSLRQTDLAGRYGGEEFAAVLPHTTGEGAWVVAQRFRAAVAARDFGSGTGEGFRVTVSVGVAALLPEGQSPLSLLDRADRALYEAKATGRNRVVLAGAGEVANG